MGCVEVFSGEVPNFLGVVDILLVIGYPAFYQVRNIFFTERIRVFRAFMEITKAIKAVTPKTNKPVSHGVGRRKSSVARVWLTRGTGKIVVNNRDYATYFDTEWSRLDATIVKRVCPVFAEYDFMANIDGGGINSQADAFCLASARALVAMDESLRPVLRKNNLLTVDSRLKERKKYGQKAARRKFQFVKR